MRRTLSFIQTLVFSAVIPACSQTTLNANSGINVTDTYAIMDVTIQGGSISFGTSPNQALHVEIGYDSHQTPLMNLYMPSTGADPNLTSINDLSVLRYAGGELIPFDAAGNRISLALPNGQPFTSPSLNRLGAGGQTLLGLLVIPSLQQYAQAHPASVTMNGPTAQIVRNSGNGAGLTFSYAQTNAGWTLNSLQFVENTSHGPISKTLQISNLIYTKNAALDAQRPAGRRSTAISQPNTNTIPGALPQASPNGGTYTFKNHGGTQNIVLQHGLFSSGSTWGRMDSWLNQDFSFGNVLTPSLPTTQSLSVQGQTLTSMIQSVGGNQYILIGHSQGGLISRYAAQSFQNNGPINNTVRGVVTMDTPNLGAALTQTGPGAIGQGVYALANSLFQQQGCFTAQQSAGCYVAAAIGIGATGIARLGVDSVDSLNDLKPGSAFLTALNQAPESFGKAAIIGKTPQRWLVSRVTDNIALQGPNPEDTIGERNLATLTNIVFYAYAGDLFVSTVLEIDWFNYCVVQGGSSSGDPYCDSDYSAAINQDTDVLLTMNKIDSYYNGLIAPAGDGSDGFVQNTSQFYPSNTGVQYTISGADSHLAATRSSYDRTALDYILKNVYQVATPPPCTFSTDVPSIGLPANGGTGTIRLGTGQNCAWSVVSDSPWIAIAPTSTAGQGPASISFTAQPLNSAVPRSGTIQIGGGPTNSATVTVNQNSGCTYSLPSVPLTPQGGFPGGTYSIGVATQPSCVWSAVTDQPFLTIGNGSGTGPGSFTFTVPALVRGPVTTTINVMGQTFSVIARNTIIKQ